ncbi:MAG: 16S rRNA (uracil(1498)-N(3))-methyltransferase [Cyanobacteriota bacterium]|nr:16S rRNA (uracil(1498)-N(3))-methyltransferase [Cyanobacteriota bacterium]
MSRELRRLLVAPERLQRLGGGAAAAGAAAALPLEAPERHYLERVLRFRSGDRLAVVDGAGGLWTARMLEGGALALEQPLAAPLERRPAPRPALELALALPKRETELVWRMATELGADRLQPLLAQRCGQRGEPPRQRWQAVVREASEQCERLWLPELAEPQEAGPWLAQAGQGEGVVSLLATTRREGLPPLAAVLGGATGGGGTAHAELACIRLAIGPEGGWSDTEEQQAEVAGWIPVSLGATILRTATAAVAGLAELAAWRTLSFSSFPGPSP